MQITHAQIRYALSIAAALLCISPLQGRAQTPSEIVKNYRRLQHDVTLLQRKHLVRSKSKDAKELQQEVHAVRQQFVDQNRPKAKTNRDKLCIVQVLRRLRQYGQAAILLGEISKTLNLGGAHEEVRYQEIEALYHKRQYEAVVPMVEQHLQQYPRGKHRQRLSNIWRKIKQGWKEGRLQGSIPASLNLEHQIGTTVDFRLDDHRGEVVLLFFFGSYGKSSLQKLPVLSTLQSKYPKGFKIFGVTTYYHVVTVGGKREQAPNETVEVQLLKKFHREQNMSFPLLVMSKEVFGKVWKIDVVPHFVLLDRNGTVRLSQTNYGNWEGLTDKLKELMTEELPTVKPLPRSKKKNGPR